MQLTDIQFFILLIGCYILSSLPIKGFKIAIFMVANALFLLSYGWMQLVFAVVLSSIVFALATFSKSRKDSWVIGTLFIVALLIIQRSCTLFSLPNIFGLMAFSYSGLKAVRYLKSVSDGNVKRIYWVVIFDYLFYFPSVLQGPIMDYVEFENVLFTDDDFNYKRRRVGFLQMLIGYATRYVLVLALLPVYISIFKQPENYQMSVKVIALLTFCIILYLDWDAYSNIVVGASKLLGMPISENFKAPLMAKDAKDFWGRWHVSLSEFLRDFVYFPLGGSRCSFIRSCMNTIITFLVCGLWHGFNLLYLIWGLANGIAVCVAKLMKFCTHSWMKYGLGQLSKYIILISLSVYGFTSLSSFTTFLGSIFISGEIGLSQLFTLNQWVVYGCLFLIYFIFDWCRYRFDCFVAIARWYVPFRFIVYFLLILCILIFGVYGPGYDAGNFIYQLF